MSSYLCPGQRNPGQGIKGKLNTAVSLQKVPYETINKTIFQFIVKRTCKNVISSSLLVYRHAVCIMRKWLTMLFKTRFNSKHCNTNCSYESQHNIYCFRVSGFFLQTNFVIFGVKIRFDYNIFLIYDNLKVVFKSDVNYLFWLLWNTEWKMEMIGITQNWFCTVLFKRRYLNLQRMTSCDFHSYYNMLYNTAYFVLNNWYPRFNI